MKTLTTEQQLELQDLVEQAAAAIQDLELKNSLNYYAIELKPKRVRRVKNQEVVADLA